MRLSARIFSTATFVVFFMIALNLCAEEPAMPAPGSEAGSGAASSYGFVPAPAVSFSGGGMAATPYSRGLNVGVPRVELFVGYSYLRAVPELAAGNRLVWLNGGSTSIAFNFNRYLGMVADFGAYTNSEMRFNGAYTSTVDVNNSNVAAISYLFGPRLSFRKYDRITPFAQVLFGGVHANEILLANCTFSCTLLPSQSSFALTAGGGLDVRVHRHIAIRVIQAEYLMTRFSSYTTGASGTQNDMRLSAGIVFRFGGEPHVAPPQPVTFACFVNPTSVYRGDSIAVTSSAINLDPARSATYTWSTDGGTVTGTSSTATIDTTNATPGTYTLKGHVSESSKPSENADCSAPYTVKPFEPPTVSCTADPSAVISGAPSTITTLGVSPQNRPLSYIYSPTAGSISGTGASVTLITTGAPAGVIGITCSVLDDKGQTASANTSVTVAVPVAAPKPTTSALCSVNFDRDAKRPSRVDNEAKACLDQIALTLQQDSGATLALVGNASSGEKGGTKLAAARAVNTKAYLVGERGIDSSRISVYSGTQDGKIVSTTLIPADATFDSAGDTAVQ